MAPYASLGRPWLQTSPLHQWCQGGEGDDGILVRHCCDHSPKRGVGDLDSGDGIYTQTVHSVPDQLLSTTAQTSPNSQASDLSLQMTLYPATTHPGMGLIHPRKPGKQMPKRCISKVDSKPNSATHLPRPCRTEASLSQKNVIPQVGGGGDMSNQQERQTFEFNDFGLIDFSDINVWYNGSLPYCDTWMAPASSTHLSLAAANWSDGFLDPLPTGSVVGQSRLAGSKDGEIAANNADMPNLDAIAQRTSELPTQHERYPTAPNTNPTYTTIPSPPRSPPDLIGGRPQLLGKEILTTQAPHYVGPMAATEDHNSDPNYRDEEGKAGPESSDVEVEQWHGDVRRQPQRTSEMAAQHTIASGCDNMAKPQETRASALETTRKAGAPIGHIPVFLDEIKQHATLTASRAQLPSPHSTEQTSQSDISPSPEALPPTHPGRMTRTMLDAATDGHRKSARIEVVIPRSTCSEPGAKEPLSQLKRRYREGNTGKDDKWDNGGASTTKRRKIQTIPSNTSTGQTKHSVTKGRPKKRWKPSLTSKAEVDNTTPAKPIRRAIARDSSQPSGARRHDTKTASQSAREQAFPRSRRDLAPRDGSCNMNDHDWSRSRRTTSANPINPQTLSETEGSKHTRHSIIKGRQRRGRSDHQNSLNTGEECSQTTPGEHSFSSSPASGVIPADGCDACGFRASRFLQLADMAWRWIPQDDSLFEALFQSDAGFSHAEKSAVMLRLCLGSIREYAREMATAGRQSNHLVQPTVPLSECGEAEGTVSITSCDDDPFSDDDSQGDSDVSEDDRSSGHSDVGGSVGNKRRGWDDLEEGRLRSYVKENKDWVWIANKLCRTEGAVKQHWRAMNL